MRHPSVQQPLGTTLKFLLRRSMCDKLAPSSPSVIHQECCTRVMRGCQTAFDPRRLTSLHLDPAGQQWYCWAHLTVRWSEAEWGQLYFYCRQNTSWRSSFKLHTKREKKNFKKTKAHLMKCIMPDQELRLHYTSTWKVFTDFLSFSCTACFTTWKFSHDKDCKKNSWF